MIMLGWAYMINSMTNDLLRRMGISMYGVDLVPVSYKDKDYSLLHR